MKILYYDNISKEGCNYYKDIIKYLSRKYNVHVVNKKNLKKRIKQINPDLIIIGFGITSKNKDFDIINIEDKNIPIFVILNKLYGSLENKIKWLKNINPKPKKIFCIEHQPEKYEKMSNIPCIRIMWSADHEIFRIIDIKYKYDLLFSGVINEKQTNNLIKKIFEKIHKIKDKYLLNLNVNYNDIEGWVSENIDGKIHNREVIKEKDSNFKRSFYKFTNEEYVKLINDSKICLVTTGPGDLIGTRFFEVMSVGKSLILCNRMDYEIYQDYLIDNFNCVMFEDENDFFNKFEYFIKNEEKRKSIVINAFEYFQKNLKWDHQVDKIINYINNV